MEEERKNWVTPIPKPPGWEAEEDQEIDGVVRCGRWARQSGRGCLKPAGWGTNHQGTGPCRLHGGTITTTTGAYSKYLKGSIKQIIDDIAEEGNPLDATGELVVLKALLARYIHNYRHRLDSIGTQEGDHEILDMALKINDQVSKTVGRIERIRGLNAISQPELMELIKSLAGAVERVFPDPDKLRMLADEWKVLINEVTGKGAVVARGAWAAGDED